MHVHISAQWPRKYIVIDYRTGEVRIQSASHKYGHVGFNWELSSIKQGSALQFLLSSALRWHSIARIGAKSGTGRLAGSCTICSSFTGGEGGAYVCVRIENSKIVHAWSRLHASQT